MFTIFLNGTRNYKISILLEGQKMNSTYFTECALSPLTKICCPQGRETHESRVMLHFNNAPVHKTEEVQKSSENFGFRRMESST
jgi:hypothetical protein